MTTGSTAAPTLDAPQQPHARKLHIPPRYLPPILITLILLSGDLTLGILESFPRTVAAIVTAILCELILGRLTRGHFPYLHSAYITGISVGILVRSLMLWPYILCSALSIVSKYVLRIDGKHLWNPSNFGISVMLFLVPGVAPLSIQWGNDMLVMSVIWLLGFFILYKHRRLHMTLTYVASFAFFAALRASMGVAPFAAELAPLTGPMYQLFAMFMVTDPATTLKSRNGQIVFVVIVALVEHLLRLQEVYYAPFYALFLVGPPVMVYRILNERRQAEAAAALT
jgi:enediyne biosynthesis protein E5